MKSIPLVMPLFLTLALLVAGQRTADAQMSFDMEHNSWHPETKLRDSGKLRKGIPDGTWKGWYADGNPRYVRTYSYDKYTRIGQEIKKHPRFIFTPLAREAKEDPRVLAAATDARASLPSAPFEQCLHHGLYINYAAGGRIVDSGYYQNGLREGYWEEWDATANRKHSGAYRHGKRYGSWTIRDENGRTRSILQYNRKGQLVHQKFYE